jgi:hypothetical protein
MQNILRKTKKGNKSVYQMNSKIGKIGDVVD